MPWQLQMEYWHLTLELINQILKEQKIILYPNEPDKFAEELKRKFFLKLKLHVGIIIVDSRLMPARIGTTGVAIVRAGIEPTKDLRGEKIWTETH